jgi:cellulose biosynthesis protein BcsQ
LRIAALPVEGQIWSAEIRSSDYVLIPIQPSKQATARVPVLLNRLKDFRDNINPSLSVLGIVANRTHWSELTDEETNRLTALRDASKDIWCQDVPFFETFIRQNIEVRAAEDNHRPLLKSDQMFSNFVDLANEVLGRLPMFCKTPSGAGTQEHETVTT